MSFSTSMCWPGATNPPSRSRRSTAAGSVAVIARISPPNVGGSPPGMTRTEPKSSTPIRPSGSSRKLPGCGSVCSSPTRAGEVRKKCW